MLACLTLTGACTENASGGDSVDVSDLDVTETGDIYGNLGDEPDAAAGDESARTWATGPEPFDESAARAAAEDELASEGYNHAYGCTDDCSGHDAGWKWRADHGYSTPGNSNSFYEGGRAFDEALDERVEEMRNEYEAGGGVPY
jgi:hypothetical protein